jgi:hypothetical protein
LWLRRDRALSAPPLSLQEREQRFVRYKRTDREGEREREREKERERERERERGREGDTKTERGGDREREIEREREGREREEEEGAWRVPLLQGTGKAFRGLKRCIEQALPRRQNVT